MVQATTLTQSTVTRSAPRFARFAPALGATVHGLDLREPISASSAEALRRGLREHGVLFFREQTLEPRHLLAFAELFGDPLRHNPYLPSHPETGGVELITSGDKPRLANEVWHSDVTWQEAPPPFTALYASELPAFGGDTVWTSSTAAYRSLPPRLAAYFDTLTAVNYVDVNGYTRPGDASEQHLEDPALLAELRTTYPPIDVPVIGTHPDTGEKYIFVTELHTGYIKGVSRALSESLLRILFSALENAQHHARFTWATGSLAVWDNRLVQHRAVHDYGSERRTLHRITIA
jgi:taurine dioxygenase